MYLAEMRLDARQAARRRLFDLYAWHRAAWAAFQGRPKSGRCFLMRVDMLPEGRFRMLLLSEERPSRPEWCAEEDWRMREIPADFLEQDLYEFDIVANPTKKVARQDAEGRRLKNGRRVVLTRESERLDWLRRKGRCHGFEVLEDPPPTIVGVTNHYFAKRREGGTQYGLHVGVRFRGVLRVTDREAFREAFRKGIGSAKAFGFGMLVLRPLGCRPGAGGR